jgi:hypothetical protein
MCISDLSPAAQAAWRAYLAAKKALGAELQYLAPPTKRLIFTERYNVLKIATVAKGKTKAAAGPAMSLDAWRKAQDEAGRAS